MTLPVITMLSDSQKTKPQLIEELESLRSRVAAFGQTEKSLGLARFALDHAADPIYWFRQDGRFFYANLAACQSLGYSRDELLSMSVSDIDPVFPASAWPTHYREMKKAGRMTFEARHRTKSGREFPVEITTNYLTDGPNGFFWACVHDITERKWMETLKNGQQQLLELISTGNTSLADILEAITRLSQDQLPHVRASILYVYDNKLRHGAAPSMPRAYIELIDDFEIGPHAGSCGTAAYRKERVIVADVATDPLWADYCQMGAEYGFSACWSEPILDTHGEVLGTFALYRKEPGVPTETEIQLIEAMASLANIAIEGKRAEAALQVSYKKSDQLQEQLLEAIESLTEGFALYDANDRLVLCNSNYREVYKESADLLIEGVRFEDHIRMSAYRGQIAAAVGREEEWVRERLEQHRNPQRSYLQQLGNGRWIRVSERKTFEGGIVGVRTDVTEQKQAEDAVRQRENDLAHAGRLSLMGEMVAGLAHEVNQPLYSIGNFSKACENYLQQNGPLEKEKLLEWIGSISDCARHGKQILSRLISFARRNDPQFKTFRIDRAIRESLKMLDFTLRQQNVSVDCDLAENVLVNADEVQVQQVLSNLICNACEAFGESDTEDAQLSIQTTRRDRFCEVSIEDNGPGLSLEQIQKAFESFSTTKSNGLGLGLAISRTILETHGGQIEIVANRHRGITCRFTLPLAQEEP